MGINVTVEKENNTYKIIEKQYGEPCRCMCVRKVTIFNVPTNAAVEFIDKDGNSFILTPHAEFCGWSTYGEGEYNLVILFNNKFSNEERALCSKTVKIGG